MAGRFSERLIEEISRKSDILEIVGSHVSLTRKGNKWWGLCPFHAEKTPSFSVDPDSNLFYCFGCHKGGSIYQFIMETEALSFPEAVERLADKAGIALPDRNEGRNEAWKNNRKALEELYTRTCNTFHWLLKNHPGAQHARQYLQSRGISEETSDAYMLGWAPADGEWLYNFLVKKKYSPAFLRETGLFSRKSPRWSYFVDRLMFPVMNSRQQVVAFSGRTLQNREPKYINSPETLLYRKSRELYGYAQARGALRSAKSAVLCEGNLDVLACMQADIPYTVAPLGTSFTEEQARLLKRSANTLIILFDGDEAGVNATFKAAVTAEKAGFTVKTALMPPESDPADILLNKGPDSLKRIVEGAILFFDYFVYLLSAQTDISGEAQEEALEKLTPYLEAVGSEVRREAYLKQLAEAMKADTATVIRDFSRQKRRKIERPRYTEPAEQISDPSGDELFLMTAVAVKPEFFPLLRELLAPEMLRDSRALSIYRVLDELSAGESVPRTDVLVELLEDESLTRFILEKAATEVYNEKAEETIRDIVNRLVCRSITEERAELIRGMARESRSDPDPDIQSARIRRIQEIDQEIMKLKYQAR